MFVHHPAISLPMPGGGSVLFEPTVTSSPDEEVDVKSLLIELVVAVARCKQIG